MSDLITPHGGLTEPVCCTVSAEDVAAFETEAAGLPKVPVSAADLSTVYRIADGTLSPLTGPMSSEVFNRVLDEAVVEQDGQKYAWTIPLSFPITSELAATLSAGQKAALTGPDGKIVALFPPIMDVAAMAAAIRRYLPADAAKSSPRAGLE